jgi:4-hydroxy-tetrahydrodipicolinate synthase
MADADSSILTGVFSVVPTPFDSAGQVDVASLRRVVDLYLGAGVNGLTALGVTSEVARLNERERALILDTILEQTAGRLPVVAGATADGLQTCIELGRAALAAGATAVMVSPPRLARPNADAVVAHYRGLSEAIGAEIVVQDYPPVSGFTMEASLLARIAAEVPRARTIKLEDAPTAPKAGRILALSSEAPVRILGGLGGVFLLEELRAGAAGTMTGFAYPEMLVEVTAAFRAGRQAEAADLFYRYVPLMRFEFQEGIGVAIRKEVLRRRGALAHAGVRAPGAPLDRNTRESLDELLTWMKEHQGVRWISV